MRDQNYWNLLSLKDSTKINLADGWPVALWLSILHRRWIQQIRGVDLLRHFITKGDDVSHIFLGSTEETLTALEKSLRHLNESANLLEFISPPFTEKTETWLPSLIEVLNGKEVDFLWVGLGTPKQDYIVQTLSESNLNIKGIFAVGAAFDFLAGSKKEVPVAMRIIGLEWLHRLITEPTRLWKRYTVYQLYFLKAIVTSSFK